MSEQNPSANATETNPVLTDERGQYTIGTFKLNKTAEILDRFRGDHTITYRLPAPGDTIEATLRNIQACLAEDADLSQVLIGKFNGQGLNLDVQKAIKTYLGPNNAETTKGMSVEEALAGAQKVADEFRLTHVRTRVASAAKQGKVAQAEAKAAKATSTALGMYRALAPALRAQYREQLLALGGVTAGELDAVDAEAPEGAPGGGHTAGGNRGRRG